MLVDNVNGINNINRNFVRSEGDFHTAGDGTRGGIAVVAVHGTAEGTTGVETAALAQVETVGSTPFFLNLHVGDVGHTMIVGPTGSGKSVLLNFLETQIRSVPDARIYVFDKGGSSRVLAAAVGGIFYDLGNESSTHSQSFQPLR